MPWAYICALLGPGLHWSRTQQELLAAIAQARRDGMHDAAEHIQIILELRNAVNFDEGEKEAPPG